MLIFLFLLFSPSLRFGGNANKPHVNLVDIKGAIESDGTNSADNVISSLTKAFKDSKSKGIILRINSPGGSPVQASQIYDGIMRLRNRYPQKKIFAVCTDLCASAAYYIASATNDIYANPSSLVGSIGVLLNGFGFTGAMDKLGIQRRLIISGDEKGFLDPFSPEKPQDQAYAQKLLDSVHQQFIKDVEKGRGTRLQKSPVIFSGLIWSGVEAKQLGLIDGFGSAGSVSREFFKTDTFVDYTKKRSFLNQISQSMGASFAHGILASFSDKLRM